MDRNTNEDSKLSDGDGGEAGSGGSDNNGGRNPDDADGTERPERPRRRRSGDALRLHSALLGGSSASLDALDALDASPREDQQQQQRRRRARSRQASEDLLTMASDAAIMGRGEQDRAAGADGQQARESTASVGQQQQQRENESTGRAARSGYLPPPRLASIFCGGGDGSDRQEPLDRDQMAEILSAALAISAGEFGFDGQLEEKPERTPGNYLDNDKRPPQ